MRLPSYIEDAYPLSMFQSSIIFQSEYDSEHILYQNIFSIHIRSLFLSEEFLLALRQLPTRHPTLRTSFNLTDFTIPLQLVHTSVIPFIEISDIKDLSHKEQENYLSEVIEREKKNRLDLKNPPLIRFKVYLRTNNTFQLIITEHEAILDGWSVASMLTELFQHYLVIVGYSEAPFSSVPSSRVRDFIALERETLHLSY